MVFLSSSRLTVLHCSEECEDQAMAFSQVDCSKCFLFPQNRVSILEQQRNIVLLMLGLDNAGKTCTAKMLVGEDLETVAPTIGFSKVSTKYKGFNVTIYDLGGSKSFRGIWPKYYHEVHGFIFVVDSADDQRLDETAEVIQCLRFVQLGLYYCFNVLSGISRHLEG